MNEIDLEEDYKTSVLAIWDKFRNIEVLYAHGCEYRKSPLLPKTIKKDAIFFVGINPSIAKSSIVQESIEGIEFYPIISGEVRDIAYFEKFKEIAKYCNNADWTHLDLFFMRETNQEVIKKLSYDNVDFLQAQLDITFDIIKRAKPIIIVVANSLASEFFGKKKHKHSGFSKIWMGFDFDFQNDFDPEIGTYRIQLGDKKIPIIFSGMLSGQRALDLGSLERLKWQIKKILDFME